MSYFRYFAINQQGQRQRGILAAAHEADLVQRLASMGLDLVTAHAVRNHVKKTLSRRDLIALFLHLAYMSRAGIALIDGLSDLRDSVQADNLREILATLLADMKTGQTLATKTWKLKLVNQQLLNAQNTTLTIKQSCIRYALASASILACGLGYIWALFDKDSLFLHDRLLKTRFEQLP